MMYHTGRCEFSIVVILTVALALCFTSAGLTWAGNGNKFVPGELLIQAKAGVPKGRIDKLLETHGAGTAGEIEQLKVRKIRVPAHALEKVEQALSKNPNISFVEKNYLAEATYEPNDYNYPSQWHLPKIDAPGAWDIETGAVNVPIAIIDSGVDPTHPDLADKLIPGYNFVDRNTDTHDVQGHGTAVAGTAAAISNNLTGVAGVAWDNSIMPLVAVNVDGYASYYAIANAITYAADKGVRVMNISIAGSSSSITLQNAVNYAWSKGAVIIAGAGNASTSTPYYPAACDNVVAVSGTTSSDTRASFSNYGDWIDISAPGTYILTTLRGGGYGSKSGTSFSTPIAAGVAAIVLSANPDLTNAQVVDILTRNADDLGTSGFDPYFGYGRVNAYQSLSDAMGSAPELDTTAPWVSLVAPPQDGATVSGEITVSVSATDDGGVDRVELYIDGELLATDATAPYQFYWDTTANADGSYELWAIAHDSAGNQGQSDVIVVSVSNEIIDDTMAPVVVISSPENGTTVSNSVTVNVSATDDLGIGHVDLFVDDVRLASDAIAPYSFIWDTSAYADGNHELRAIAVDTAGKQSQSNSVTVNTDNQKYDDIVMGDTEAPYVAITSPANGASVVSVVSIKAMASDNEGISSIELYIDGKLVKVVNDKSTLKWNWNTRKESQGAHTLSVTAHDAAGNAGEDSITVYN